MLIQRWREATAAGLPELFQFRLLRRFTNVQHGISTRHSEVRQQADVLAAQPHGDRFAFITKRPTTQPKVVSAVDALLTGVSDVQLRIGTSDCVPLVVYDARQRRGGVIHAGVKGTTQDILRLVLKQLAVPNVWLGVGPAIGKECYEQIDLQLENILQAKAMGVPLGQIEVMRWCTKCHSDVFFSYRAGDHQNFGTYFRLAKT